MKKIVIALLVVLCLLSVFVSYKVYATEGAAVLNSNTTGKLIEIKEVQFYEKLAVPPQNNIVVSIVIPAYNQFHYTYLCIKSIIENSKDYEIILADDNSTDETKNAKLYFDGIRVVHNETNLRFLKNVNNASSYARGKYIVFLNNDTQVQEGWL